MRSTLGGSEHTILSGLILAITAGLVATLVEIAGLDFWNIMGAVTLTLSCIALSSAIINSWDVESINNKLK
jgi:hypothetical protein